MHILGTSVYAKTTVNEPLTKMQIRQNFKEHRDLFDFSEI